MSSNYTGVTPEQVFIATDSRFFYGLRRTDNGELFLAKADQLKKTDSITINKPGDMAENYTTFSQGVDFYDGRDDDHNLIHENLNYEQHRWDNRNILYYVNSEGELVQRINENYIYDDNSSSNGL
jgi:hypothetical protein